MEANVSTIFDGTSDLRGLAGSQAVWISHVVSRCWRAFLKWRREQAAIAELATMSDRNLRDIGLNRYEIAFAMKGELACIRRPAP
jgi:uncharacterized protein YjiS (DUF1127 family)